MRGGAKYDLASLQYRYTLLSLRSVLPKQPVSPPSEASKNGGKIAVGGAGRHNAGKELLAGVRIRAVRLRQQNTSRPLLASFVGLAIHVIGSICLIALRN